MATVRSTLALNDGMTPVMRRINKAMSLMLNNFVSCQEAAGKNVNTRWLNEARQNIGETNTLLNEIENKYKRCESVAKGFNDEIDRGTKKAGNLMNTIKGMAGAYLGMQGVKALVGLSDAQAQTTARLNLLVTDGGSVDALEQKINASAMRSRSAYLDTAAAVSKLGLNAGNAFNHDMDQVIAFTEQVNKQFVIGGATAQEQSNAMVQLTQAMAAGALRGEELNSILDSAPGIARAIEQYMGAAEGSIKGLAEDGKVTAQVVKNAMFATAEQTNAKFESMPMTWSQVWTQAGNIALKFFNPLLSGINWLANNLAIVTPIVLGAAAALGVYFVTVNRVKIAEMASAVWTGITTGAKALATLATWAFTKATLAQAGAQWGLNAAMLACPLTWILIAIIAIIAIIYAVIGWINKAQNKTISATGVIFGAVCFLAAGIWNTIVGVINAVIQFLWTSFVEPWIGIIEWVLNVFNGGFDSFGDAVFNLLGNIISGFLSLGKVVTKIIDAIFGTDWTSGLNDLQNKVLAWGKNDNAITLSREAPTIQSLTGGKVDTWAYSDAWNTGYNAGEFVENKVSSMFSFDDLTKGANIPTAEQFSSLGDIADDTSDLAKNSGKTTEELAYLRDIAEREAVNRFTTAEVKVELGGVTNNLSNNADIDGVISYLSDGLVDALSTAAEGVY